MMREESCRLYWFRFVHDEWVEGRLVISAADGADLWRSICGNAEKLAQWEAGEAASDVWPRPNLAKPCSDPQEKPLSLAEGKPDDTFPTHWEAALTSRRKTVADMCRMAGVAQSTWQRWKTGVSAPRIATQNALWLAWCQMSSPSDEAA